MSVVNKMLNDLEDREHAQGIVADYQPPTKKQTPIVWFVLLIILIAAGVAGYMQFSSSILDQNTTTLNAVSQESSVQRSEEAKVDTKPTVSEATEKEAVSRISQASIASLAKIAEQDASRNRKDTTKDQSLAASESDAVISSVDSQFETLESSVIDNAEQAQSVEEPRPVEYETQQSKEFVAKNDSKESFSPPPRSAMVVNPSESNQSVDDTKLLAQKALADKNSPQAITLLSQLLNEQPGNINARKQLASLFFASGDSGKAETLLKYGLQLNAQQHDIRLMLARLYQRNSRNTEALMLLKEASPDIVLNIDYYGQRASLAQQLKSFEQAQEDYSALTSIEPEQAKWWLGLGISADSLSDSGVASQAYRKALSFNQLERNVVNFMQKRLRDLGR